MNYDFLVEYLKNLYADSFHQYLIHNRLWYLIKGDKTKNILFKAIQMRQKKLNQSILEEMKNLQEYCNRKNIRNLFVKGLTLAYMLYDSPEERIFDDIDVFIEPGKLNLMSQYLIEQGYRDENGILLTHQSVFDYYHPTHLSTFTKNDVALEIHVMPYYTNTISNDFLSAEAMEEFYNTREWIMVDGVQFPTLERNRNALFFAGSFHQAYHILCKRLYTVRDLSTKG